MNKLKRFRWCGLNRLQQRQKGIIVAETERAAKQRLMDRGLQQLKLQRDWQCCTKTKKKEICEFWVQLAFLLQSSLPLNTSLQILKRNCINIALYQWLAHLLNNLENGILLSAALEGDTRYVTVQERQLLYIGEMTGKLSQICQQIAEQRNNALALQRKVQKILFYPIIVLSISLILTVLLLLFIVPQFAEIYGNQTLPVFTSVLLNLSEGVQIYFLQIILIFGLAVLLIHLQLKHSLWLNQQKEKLIQYIPYLNQIIQLNRLVYFCRNLHLMLSAGMPLKQALDCFLPQQKSWKKESAFAYHFVLVNEVRSILYQISCGNAFSASVSAVLFPDSAQQMLHVGEKSGQFVPMLRYIADNYQQQLEHQIDLFAQMLEPLLMLIIGGLIGLIMLGMYLPIFSIGAVIQ